MNLKYKNSFKEAELGEDFAKEKVEEFKSLINLSQSFTVVSMPGVGVSYFLKYLACQDFANFFHIDIYSLPSLTQRELYKLLYKELTGEKSLNGSSEEEKKDDQAIFQDCQKAIFDLSQQPGKVVLIFSRFDALKKVFDSDFFSNLQSLITINPGKVSLIFTSVLPLNELAPEAVSGGNLSFYSKVLYFKPFSKKDLVSLFTINHSLESHPELENMVELSGGHSQLLHIFINSHKQNNLLLDKFVTLQFKDLISYLDYVQRKQIEKIALGTRRSSGPSRKLDEVDGYLLGVGYVKDNKLFCPLLAEYIKTHTRVKLPVKEAKLFKLLRRSMNSVVSKEEIFKEVWGENNDSATDWALDALIYRLRKHPFLKNHGYVIESHKKVGYTLIQT